MVKITGGPKGRTKAKRATFRFRMTAGTGTFQCRLDKRRWSSCKSPKRYSVKPGRHTFRVRGVAADGTLGKPVKRSFKRVRS